jgi:hypothetical protein
MRRSAAVAALAALVLAGCGSSRLSPDELRAQASQLCNRAQTQTDRIATPLSPDGAAAFVQKGIAVMEPELRHLRALRPPQELASVYAAGTGALAAQIATLKAAVATIDRGDSPVTATKALGQKLAPLRTRADAAWRALQVPACLSR